jgi:hypothetical protein
MRIDDSSGSQIESRRRWQAGDDRGRSARKHLGVRSDLDARSSHGAAAGRIDVEANHTPTRFREVLRKRAAHDSKTNHPDR